MATTDEQIQQAAIRYRNWGKWGPNDQHGTLNYITPAKIAEAARLVRAGRGSPRATPGGHDHGGIVIGKDGEIIPAELGVPGPLAPCRSHDRPQPHQENHHASRQ